MANGGAKFDFHDTEYEYNKKSRGNDQHFAQNIAGIVHWGKKCTEDAKLGVEWHLSRG